MPTWTWGLVTTEPHRKFLILLSLDGKYFLITGAVNAKKEVNMSVKVLWTLQGFCNVTV